MCELPAWVQYVQAIGLPVLGVILACVGAYIAWQQKRIADIRLQHDLYDRRFRIYEAARKLLAVQFENTDIPLEEFYAFVGGTSDAVFLFDLSVVEYLYELREKAVRLRLVERRSNNPNLLDDARGKATDEAAEIQIWFSKQFEVLISKFKPFMRLDEHYLKTKVTR